MSKKLQLHLGGHPATLDDFQMLQDSALENLADTITGLLPDGVTKCILYGCVYTVLTGELTSGAIFYNGEVFRVEAQTLISGSVWYSINEVPDVYDPVIYADSTSKNVHLIRTLYLTAGSGEFELSTIGRIEDLLGDKIKDALQLATEPWVTALFSTLRNGYDPILRKNPATSALEWAYASPPHPSLPGTPGNPWNVLGFHVFEFYTGTLGLFEARVNTSRTYPNTPNFWNTLMLDVEIIDEGSAFVLMRKYVAPVSGTYDFLVENIKTKVVSTTPPHTVSAHTVLVTIALMKNGSPVATTVFSNGADGRLPVHTAGLPAINTEYFANTISQSLALVAGDEITIGIRLDEDSAGTPTELLQIMENFRNIYHLETLNWLTI